MKELFQDKKRLLLAGGAVLLIVIAIVLVLVLRGHSRSVQYENYMDAAEESILSEDYAKAKEQDAPEENSVTIAGQSYATAASSVTISGTNLSAQDLDALASFENLTTLSLKNCGLKDLDFLEELDTLTSLTLSDNRIEDLRPLEDLDQLKTLYLDNNPIEDFSPLYELRNLTTLSIKGIELTQTQYDELADNLKRCSIFGDDTVAEELTLGGVTLPVGQQCVRYQFSGNAHPADLSGSGGQQGLQHPSAVFSDQFDGAASG